MIKMKNYFFCTDFDGTLIEKNSHEYLDHLCVDRRFLQRIDEEYEKDHRWFERMNKFYRKLKENHLRKEEIVQEYDRIELLEGVEPFIRKLKSMNWFLSIVSDGYDEVIRYVLQRKNLFDCFNRIECNSSEWNRSEQLKIVPYDKRKRFQCPNGCPSNLCKGLFFLLSFCRLDDD